MLLIAGDTLESTPTHNSTPSDNIIKITNCIIGVNSLPFYSVCAVHFTAARADAAVLPAVKASAT